MVDIIVFQVALQKKMINFVTFKPKELGSLYYQYIIITIFRSNYDSVSFFFFKAKENK